MIEENFGGFLTSVKSFTPFGLSLCTAMNSSLANNFNLALKSLNRLIFDSIDQKKRRGKPTKIEINGQCTFTDHFHLLLAKLVQTI